MVYGAVCIVNGYERAWLMDKGEIQQPGVLSKTRLLDKIVGPGSEEHQALYYTALLYRRAL